MLSSYVNVNTEEFVDFGYYTVAALIGVKKERTTLGLNGGVIFLALRSSQLMGEKNMWFLISICEETQMMKN